MIDKFFLFTLGIAICIKALCFGVIPSNEAVKGAAAIQYNTRLASSISVTRDSGSNIVSFHVNGINPSDAQALLLKTPSLLSSEFTIINGISKEGTSCCYMLPSSVATPIVIEGIAKELVNAGAINLQISKQSTGKS